MMILPCCRCFMGFCGGQHGAFPGSITVHGTGLPGDIYIYIYVCNGGCKGHRECIGFTTMENQVENEIGYCVFSVRPSLNPVAPIHFDSVAVATTLTFSGSSRLCYRCYWLLP